MKIALFHNSYQVRGGEDSMFELEQDALRALGHEVVVYHVSNMNSLGANTVTSKIRTALGAAYNKSSEKNVRAFLQKERPEISHVHNWFPLLSPSVYSAHQQLNIPVVQTLHNYRLSCAAANYRRDGKDCTQCTPGNNCAALKHRCYRNSLAGTMVWKHVVDRNWKNGQFNDSVDHYICPSQEVMDRHVQMGLSPERMSIIPNACPDPQEYTAASEPSQRMEISFVGRLVREKGAHVLLSAWKKLSSLRRAKSRLNIIGDGPELNLLKALAGSDPRIAFHGALDRRNTLQHLCQSNMLVCPSIWAEPFGLTIIEAMGSCLPVIASKLGGPAKIVDHGRSGYLVEAGDCTALGHKMNELLASPTRAHEMGQHGRRIYESNYTHEAHAVQLTQCFETLVEKNTWNA